MEIKHLLCLAGLLVSAGLIVGGWYDFVRTRRWLATAVRTQGQIVSIRKKVSRDITKKASATAYYPTIAFLSPLTGQRITFETQVSNDSPVGKPVAVYYQPSNPADARFANFFELWFTPLVCWPNGIGFMAAAIHEMVSWFGR